MLHAFFTTIACPCINLYIINKDFLVFIKNDNYDNVLILRHVSYNSMIQLATRIFGNTHTQ